MGSPISDALGPHLAEAKRALELLDQKHADYLRDGGTSREGLVRSAPPVLLACQRLHAAASLLRLKAQTFKDHLGQMKNL